MKKSIAIIALLVMICLAGCKSEHKIENVNYTKSDNTYILPKGMKVVGVSDKQYHDLGVLMRPMRAGEKAETYVWCFLDKGRGAITIKETE